MKLLIIDTETTNIDEPQICEIAGTLYQVGENVRETGAIATISTLLPVKQNPVEFINGIPSELTLTTSDWIRPTFLGTLNKIVDTVDYTVAFNAEFDAPLVNELLGINPSWLCAMKDFDWGYPVKPNGNYKLTDLALWMGIGVSTVHRAGDDVRLLVECFNRRKEVLPEMVEAALVLAKSPVVELKALVSYENRGLAKNAGFSWDSDRKMWVKKVKECKLDEFKKILEFDVEVMDIS